MDATRLHEGPGARDDLDRGARRRTGRTLVAALAVLAVVAGAACSGSEPTPFEPPPDPPPDTTPAIDSVPVLTALPATLDGLRLDAAVGYEPRWALWSNGLAKDRAVLLPTGASVDISDRGSWAFPDGAILLKTFSVRQAGGAVRPLETRALLRRGGVWNVGVYLWNEAGTSASLSDRPQRIPVPVVDADGNAFDHLVPSRADCARCHGASPNFVLGFDELQLNRTVDGADQLAALAAAGVLDRAPPADAERIDDADPEAEWVMGYLTANCVHCHHEGASVVDLSHTTFLTDVVGGVGPSGTTLVVPGDAESSSVYALLREGVMPPVGVQLPDTAAMSRLRGWIESLGG